MMKEDWVYRRGDIYLANLGKPEGSQQGGVRPVVILQNDIGNYYSDSLCTIRSQTLSVGIYGIIVFLDDLQYLFFCLCGVASVLIEHP